MTVPKLLTTAEVGQLTGFSSRTIARWCREGKVPAQKVGRVWRVHKKIALLMGKRYVLPEDE
jgi:excisionase family DNA binding protein